MRIKYLKLKDTNEHLLRQLEKGQQEIDHLNVKKAELEEELSMSPVKQEAGNGLFPLPWHIKLELKLMILSEKFFHANLKTFLKDVFKGFLQVCN